jgi:hypothetical protein
MLSRSSLTRRRVEYCTESSSAPPLMISALPSPQAYQAPREMPLIATLVSPPPQATNFGPPILAPRCDPSTASYLAAAWHRALKADLHSNNRSASPFWSFDWSLQKARSSRLCRKGVLKMYKCGRVQGPIDHLVKHPGHGFHGFPGRAYSGCPDGLWQRLQYSKDM